MATTSISNTYTGDGTTTLFSFTFPYIDEADVKIELDDVLQTNTYGFANATQIEFNTAPASGVEIYIYRETNVEQSPNVFYPGAAIRARDLNDNFTPNLYITEEARFRSNEAVDASELAQAAATAADASATAAQTAATAAQTSATTAQTQAAAAQASATAAQTSSAASAASAAQASSDATQAATDAATAISTANAASTTAASAVSTANAASTLATTADGKADTAIATANSATTTAQGADTKADTAIASANTANTTANNAVTTANSAVTTANTASTTANTAATNAQTALDAVGDVLDFDIIANVAAIPSSPSDADAVQVTDSSGIESFTPLTGLPSGFVGDSGIYVRLVYRLTNTSWEYITYAANDPDSRYVQLNPVAIGIDDLDDFAYTPSSNTVTLTGPSSATNPTGANAYIGLGATPNSATATIRFEKSTNTQFLNGINQLTAGDSITLGWNNAGSSTTTTTTFVSISDTVISGVTYSQLIVNSPLGSFGTGNYPFSVTSTQIINGTEPLRDGDVLRYDTSTSKWTASTSASGFIVTSQTLTSDQAFDANVNAACIGPVAVDSGVTVTIGANSKLVVLN